MAQCFLHGNGGANVLNFKVVGNPQPTNPKENTIWIDTVTKITSWFFSAKEPKLVSATKNVLNLKDGKTVTNGGVTYTNNGDGTYARKGTASDVNGNVWLWGGYNVAPAEDESNVLVTLESGKTYFASDCVVFSFENGSGYSFRGLFTVDPAVFKDGLKITGVRNPVHEVGKVYSDTVYPMICEGSEAGEWEPFDATGQIWISTGVSNLGAFNALKKNGIQVYPIAAKQYVGGAWVDKAAKTYQGGKWVDWWNGELYYAGNEYTFLTGGFVTSGTCTLEKQADRMKLTNNAVGGILTKNPIDLTEYKTVELKVIPYTDDGYCLIATKKATTTMYNDSSIAASKIGSTTNGVLATRTIDVSSLSGNYYIGVGRFDSYAISLDVISLKLIK